MRIRNNANLSPKTAKRKEDDNTWHLPTEITGEFELQISKVIADLN